MSRQAPTLCYDFKNYFKNLVSWMLFFYAMGKGRRALEHAQGRTACQ